ncbi:MAG: tetratricopeptide repeat protein [Gemmatimonadota bacterium]
MNAPDWPRILNLAEEVWGLPREERERFLAALFESDPNVREPLERILGADERAPTFLRAAGGLDFAQDIDRSATPERLGPYAILEEIGEGGMGRVFVAERADGRFERRTALKILASAFASESARERFRGEAGVLARLEHPNVARLYDAGVDQGVAFLVMELVDGRRITDFADSRGLSATDRVLLFEEVCGAVQYAHQQLVVHRDLKPANILVTDDGVVKLLDFGVAELHGDEAHKEVGGASGMTPAYASPEQRRGEPTATSTDVYSLGVVLHELLTGRRPRSDPSGASVSGWTETDTPVGPDRSTFSELPASLRGDLECILGRALEEDPARRYPSAQALLDDLVRFRTSRPVSARSATVSYRAHRFVRRNRVAVLGSALLSGSIVAGAVGSYWQGRVAALERDRAEVEAARAEEVTEFLTGVFNVSMPGDGPPAYEISAAEILDRGARRVENELASQPLLQAQMMGVLGRVYRGLAEDSTAHVLLERAVARNRAELGADHPRTIAAVVDLAEHLANRFDRTIEHEHEAVRLFDVAVSAARQRPDLRGELARALAGLGSSYLMFLPRSGDAEASRGRLEEARSVARELNDLGLLGDATHFLAWWHMHTGGAEDAERLFQEALDLRERRWGATSPQTFSTLTQLGWFYEGIGRYEDARPVLERALEARRSIYGPDHPRMGSSLNGLGLVHLRLGAFETAEFHLREALRLREETMADSVSANTRAWLAQALAGQARFDEASAEFDQALTFSHGSQRGRILNDYGVFLRNRQQLAEAERRFRQAWEAQRDDLGETHPYTATVLGNLGGVVSARGRQEEAVPLLTQAVDIIQATRGADHASLGSILVSLGWLHFVQGDADEAHRVLDRAHGIVTASWPEDHWRVGHTKLYYGVALRGVRRASLAEEVLLDAHAILAPHKRARGEDWYWVNTHLAQLYAGDGRDEEAARFRAMIETPSD